MLLIFTLSIFASALLLFVVQPMVAKFILPSLGGSPGVWNTCMLFFQAALLLGYGYAHLLTTRVKSLKMQVIIHAIVLGVAAVALPVSMPNWTPPATELPVGWLLGLLAVMIGGPFFALSTNGPLMQRWFSATGHRAAKDPYFLYAASNLGSMISLLGYPFLIEGVFTRREQGVWWAVGYGVFVLLAIVCGVLMLGRAKAMAKLEPSAADDVAAGQAQRESIETLSWRRRLWWVALAFVPSSLMLGITQYLTTDIASVPLLWVIPLAIYLLTFIVAFSPRLGFLGTVSQWLLPISAGLVALVMYLGKDDKKWDQWVFDRFMPTATADEKNIMPWVFAVQLGFLLIASLACHGRLAKDRPGVSRLTEYFLWLSVGGVLGGLFNALIAPMVFSQVLEYPIVVVLACLVAMPGVVWPDFSKGLGQAVVAGVRVVLCVALGVVLARTIAAGAIVTNEKGEVVARQIAIERTFFGVHRVYSDGAAHSLTHGAITHGVQLRVPSQAPDGLVMGPDWPTKYFSPLGPIGDIFRGFTPAPPNPFRVAVVGLGVGTLGMYGQEGQEFDFYEIDPAVKKIASDAALFSFLDLAERQRRVKTRMIMGDARITLRTASEAHYDIIFLDAFSSDSIPIHLITREAVEEYLKKLKPDGVLVFNVTNRYVEVRGVLTAIAGKLGLTAYSRNRTVRGDELDKLMENSTWMLMARRPEHLRGITTSNIGWNRHTPQGDEPLWTDDAASILDRGVLRWRQAKP
jgi:SAM-dependent methyltransferase